MTPAEVLDALAALAEETGLRVRVAPAQGGETAVASGVCRVRGELWVVLAAADPLEERVAVLARALRAHAGPALDARWLPPALREHLGGG